MISNDRQTKPSGLSPYEAPEPIREKTLWERFGITEEELAALIEHRADYQKRSKIIVFMVGVLLTPISLAGSLLGFVRGYNRILRPLRIFPDFFPMRPVIRFAMIAGAIATWLLLIIAVLLILPFFVTEHFWIVFVIGYLFANTIFSMVVYSLFRRWRIGVNNRLVEGERFGTARFADSRDLAFYKKEKRGLYIGGDCHYNKQGHMLTCAGSRSGKFTNLIAPNLLGWGNIAGSYFIIDPKAEIACVTYGNQRESKRQIVVLNPWGLQQEKLPPAYSYNPMDILDADSPNLVDDVQMLAEMLVPLESDPRNRFFSDSARTIISGLILYIAVSETDDRRSLTTLWKWTRYHGEMWTRLIAEMENADDLPCAKNLLYAAAEIQKLQGSGQNTWGSILSSVLQATDFLKSFALQEALMSGFDPYLLAEGNITLYVVIPADKLQSHSRYLRLLCTSMMRAVIRKPDKQVVFVLDEFAALGYLPEIETALGAYAGFNVTVWAIVQSLIQLKKLYGDNWEVFVGNSAVRQYFGIHNNFDAEYISKAIGKASHVVEKVRWFGTEDAEATQRELITPDELRIESGRNIFTFIDDIPPAIFKKLPYYQVKELDNRAGDNPYLK